MQLAVLATQKKRAVFVYLLRKSAELCPVHITDHNFDTDGSALLHLLYYRSRTARCKQPQSLVNTSEECERDGGVRGRRAERIERRRIPQLRW